MALHKDDGSHKHYPGLQKRLSIVILMRLDEKGKPGLAAQVFKPAPASQQNEFPLVSLMQFHYDPVSIRDRLMKDAKDREAAPAKLQPTEFTREQVCRMLGLRERQFSSWERQGWIVPTAPSATALPRTRRRANARYSFSDLVTLRTLLRLRENGVSARRLRMVHAALKERLAQSEDGKGRRNWSELQMRSEGTRVSVFFHGTRMEPLSGQLLFDYHENSTADKVRSFSQAGPFREAQDSSLAARAERFFQAGLRYEERPGATQRAIRAYEKAIELNPHATGAFINLGTIHYNQGRMPDAERCYRAALENSPHYPLVHFNLANLFDEIGNWAQACHHYEEAIRLDPTYPDPRYNLALVYEKLGRHGKALQQWRSYLKLDSQSPWASHAKKRVDQAPLRVLPSKKAPADAR